MASVDDGGLACLWSPTSSMARRLMCSRRSRPIWGPFWDHTLCPVMNGVRVCERSFRFATLAPEFSTLLEGADDVIGGRRLGQPSRCPLGSVR